MQLNAEVIRAAKRELLRRESRDDYLSYCEYAHEGRFLRTAAMSYVCRKVQTFVETDTGHAFDVMIIELPPQHGKSMGITETLPSWYEGKRPEKRTIEISYNQTYARKFGRKNREKVRAFGADLFGVQLNRERNAADEWEIYGHAGGMISRGVDTGITGNPCDLMIIDDPIKSSMEADSETYRRRLADMWETGCKTRLSAGAKVILILTRWHEEDLAGYLIRTVPDVEVLRLPCEAEENDPLGRPVGAALCPELGKGDKWLKEFKASFTSTQGSRAWNALFQGRPTSAEGNLIRREWWKYYEELPPRMAQTIMSVDASFKDDKGDDFVAIQTWGKLGPYAYLIDAVKRRMDFPTTVREIRLQAKAHPEARPIYIEDKANGPAIINMLRREIPGIVPVNPDGGKLARVNAVSGFIESGHVLLPRYAPFTGDFVESFSSFPFGAHDDDVDACSQALDKLYYFHGQLRKETKDDYDRQVDSLLNF